MPYLIDCDEWRILQELKGLLEGRQAKHKPQPDHRSIHFTAQLFETELRCVFLVEGTARDLTASEFQGCLDNLSNLCSVLDHLVHDRFVGPSCLGKSMPYTRLKGLIQYLESSSDKLDLVAGPHQTLFRLPEEDNELRKALETAKESNDFLSQLLTPPQDPARSLSVRKQKSRVWENTRMRDRVTSAFEVLFKHFGCGKQHEVMLKLSENPDELMSLPSLHLALSSCPDLCPGSNNWQEAHCGRVNISNDSITEISNICEDLQRNSGQGKGLALLIEDHGLFGAWTGLASEAEYWGSSSRKSLDQLIEKGAFEPLNSNNFFRESSSTRFSPKEKRALAVKLGYCLMDFFNADLSSKRIYLLSPSYDEIKQGLPYLSFSSSFPASADSHDFQIGHPTLLSFAKLLLEIDCGQSIQLSISPQCGEANRSTWVELLHYVENLETERSDSYVEAIRGCLLVHQSISRSLRSNGSCGKDTDLKIREKLYRKVVKKLELGLVESTPRTNRKRDRSESPPPVADRRHNPFKGEPKRATQNYQAVSSSQLPVWSVRKLDRRPATKKQRAPNQHESLPEELPLGLSSSLGVSTEVARDESFAKGDCGLFDDNTPLEFPKNVCQYADDFLETHEQIYNKAIRDVVKEGTERIKVAILDTGVDIRHLSIRASRERIREVRSWVNNLGGHKDSKAGDSSGHGTHVTSLFLNVAPDCDIYIARIAEHHPVSPCEIAKAITHAVTEWQVDIISMSFGLFEETEAGCDELRASILAAHAAGILMFTAASNSGAHSTAPAFPARLSNVFCIYAGDGMGNSSRTNPTAQQHDYNFLTLGEAVEAAWPRPTPQHPFKRRKSGTSFATPIAAGIAALVLLYARQNLSPEDARKLKQYEKMRDMLLNMSNERHGYNVISASKFFEKSPEYRKMIMMNVLNGTL